MVIGIDASRANARIKTGTEWYSWHLIRRLPSLLPQHSFRLYSRDPLEPALQQVGSNVESRVLGWRLGFLWSHLRLSWEIFRHRPDCLFVPADTVPVIVPTATVTTVHDIAFERYPELYRRSSVQRRIGWLRPLVHAAVRLFTLGRYSASEVDYHRWSVRHALRVSKKIIAISAFTKNELIERLQAKPDSINVVYQGVVQPSEFAASVPSEAREIIKKLGLRNRYFLFNGRLERKKNLLTLIRAYQRYRQRTTEPADLVLVGQPGHGWEEVEAALKIDGSEGTRRLDWQPPAELSSLFALAHGYVFLSEYEGFGRPPLEAMSAGVPVLASRIPCHVEVLNHAAELVDQNDVSAVADGLYELDRNEELRQRLRTAGLAWVRKYTWETAAKETADILEQVLGLSKTGKSGRV